MPRRPLLALVLATLFVLLAGCNGPDSRVRGTVQSGDSAARQRALREALHYYRTAAVAEPASLDAQTRRGGMAEVLGEFDEALDAYGRAARIEPSARAYQRAGILAERMGNTAVAIDYLTASLNAAPTRSERLAQSGLRWADGLHRSLNASPLARMLPTWVFRTLDVGRAVLGRAGVDHDVTAAALFTTLVESGDPARALELARARGWVRDGVDYCAGAAVPRESEVRALVGMLAGPEQTDCLLRVGRSLADGGMVRLARLVLLDRSRHSADPRVRHDAAAFMARRLPGHEVSKLAESLNIAGYNLHHRFGDAGGAAAAYQRAIAADPKFSWPYANLGRLYMDMAQPEVALEWLRTAVRINPKHFRAYVNLGLALQTLQRDDEAVPVFRAALALDSADAFVHAKLGRSLLHLGLDAEGVQALQVAVRLDPSLSTEREFLSRRVAGDPRGFPSD